MITLATLETLAVEFLNLADELNEKVSAYIDGSNADEDVNAYWAVREADKKFIDAYNRYYGDRCEYGLNYEIAESFVMA